MRLLFILCFSFAMLCAPVLAADDQSSQQEVVKIATAFTENFDKQNSTGISALFTKEGIFVNPTGTHTDVAQFYAGAFKAGIDHIEITVKQATALGADTMIGVGEFQTSGKNPSGAAIGESGYWTATYVRDGGTWKLRMLTGFPKPPPPK
jgi:ketosteroid isomerase-like protein